MAISFNLFPSSWRASKVAIELAGKKRSVSGDYIPEKILIVGQYLQSKTGVVVGTPVKATTLGEIGDAVGYGCEIYRQAKWILDALGGFSDNLWYCPVAEPSGAAAGTITVTFTGDATSNGTHYLSLGGTLYELNVISGDTEDEQAAALVAMITADVEAPFSAAVGGTGSENIVTLTSKNKSVNANEMFCMSNPSGTAQSGQNPSGTAITYSGSGYFASGSGNPDVSSVFDDGSGGDKLGDTWFTLITCPYRDSTALGLYKTWGENRRDPAVKRFFASVVGYTKLTYSQFAAIPATMNSKSLAPVWDTRSLVPSFEFAAAVTGTVAAAATVDPGRPFKTLALNIPVRPEILNLSYAKVDALFRAGGGYFMLDGSGVLRLGDIGMSYRTTAGGANSEEWYDLVSVTRRQIKVYQCDTLFNSDPYIRGMVGSNDLVTAKEYVIKPNQVIADLFRLVDGWATEGWTKNPDQVKETIAAEINATNNSRIDAELTDDPAQALRIIAVKFGFLY